MRVKFRAGFTLIVLAALSATSAFASRVHRAPTSGHAHTKHSSHKKGAVAPAAAKSHKTHGQQSIDSQRVTAIQEALVREHYLSIEPNGKWDSDTQAAMLKFQADQGWQTRLTPDSRALIKLGLGPNHAGAINAGNGANFNTIGSPAPATEPQAQGFVAASGVSH